VRNTTQFARQLRTNLTDAERHLWRHLRYRQLNGHKFRRQQPVGSYIVDFVCFEKKVIVEVDGGQHLDDRIEDDKRTAWLAAQAFHVLRFWNHDVLSDVNAVLTVIDQALRAQPCPPTQPSPTRGGGNKKTELPCKGGGNEKTELPCKVGGNEKIELPRKRGGNKKTELPCKGEGMKRQNSLARGEGMKR